MMRARVPTNGRHWLGAAAVLVFAGDAREAFAYCRTTTAKLPAGYDISDGCVTSGFPVFWRNACVGFSMQRDGSASIALDVATAAIEQAFATWSKSRCEGGEALGITATNLGPVACSEIRYNQDGPNQNLIVFRESSWPYADAYNTLALTTVTFSNDTGEIFDADMEINNSERAITATDTVPAEGYDLLSIVTHEVGHFLGLANTPNQRSTMYPAYEPGTSTLRSLAADDIAGICSIYPSVQERGVTTSLSATGFSPATACDPTPRDGFTGQCKAPPVRSNLANTNNGCSASPGRPAAPQPFGVVFASALALAGVAWRRVKRKSGV